MAYGKLWKVRKRKMKYNMIVKRVKGKEYLIVDMIATNLNEKQFEKIKGLNMNLFSEYVFVPYNETNFTWWLKVSKYLTKSKLYSNQAFDVDFYGNVTRY